MRWRQRLDAERREYRELLRRADPENRVGWQERFADLDEDVQMEGVAPPDPVAVGPPISVAFRTVTTAEAWAAGLRAVWGEAELVSLGGGTWRYVAGTVVGHDYYSPAQTRVPCQLCEM